MPQRAPGWAQVKRALNEFDKPTLIRLLQDLYRLNADNKIFLASRLIEDEEVDLEALSETYRNTIRNELNPARGFPRLNLRAARKAITDFKKACQDPAAVADLMIFYVEQGVICTTTYGDIDERFYNSLESVYAEAIKVISNTYNPAIIERFRDRMQNIVWKTSGIGWGFHDELNHMYHNDYPPEDVEPD